MTSEDNDGPPTSAEIPHSKRRTVSLADAVSLAMERHHQGRLTEAEPIYRQLLSKVPDHTEVLHLLGVLLHQTNRLDEAVERISRAIELMPGEPRYHLSIARLWIDRGAFEKAARSLQRAIDFGEETPETLNNLTVCLYQIGRADDAVAAGRRAVSLAPRSAEVLVNLANALREIGELDEAAETYERALELAPRSVLALNALASTYRLLGRNDRALECYEQAITIEPENVDANRGAQFLYARLVPRWHFPMLNDEHRNSVFDVAITKATQRGSVVLDIGTGSGLLAMMAARAGAETVVACEAVATIADVAQRIVRANGLDDRIIVLHKRSNELQLGVDLPRRADVVIAEILDVGLLGEGVLPVLRHARQHLANPDAVLIPRAATVTAMLVESSDLVEQERVETAAGFDVRLFNEFSLPHYSQRRLRDFSYCALTEPFEVARFDFGSNQADHGGRAIEVRATREGTCHAVAFWYRLELDDENSFDTGPDGPSSHWQQAVQLVATTPVSSGQSVLVDWTYDVDTIHFELIEG